jgi:hypothetical protein
MTANVRLIGSENQQAGPPVFQHMLIVENAGADTSSDPDLSDPDAAGRGVADLSSLRAVTADWPISELLNTSS